VSDPQQNPGDAPEETFISHLVELRDRIIRAGLAVIVVFLGLVYWAPDIFRLLARPLMENLPKGGRMIVTDVTGSFFVPMKVTMLVALVIALPIVLYQIWAFVAPGLYAAEKNAIVPFVIISTGLFIGGAVFGYTQIFPVMFAFFTSYDTDWVKSAWTMHEVFKLTTSMFLAFGVAFELPVFVFLLAVAGIVDAPTLFRGTRYAVLVIFIAAAVITPSPDWVSQMLLGVPMVALYLIGVGVAYLFGPRRDKAASQLPVPTERRAD